MQSINKAAESYAICAFQFGVKVHLPLSAAARKYAVRIARSRAGLAELQAVACMQRAPFQSDATFHMEQLVVRTAIRNATEAREA